MIQLDSPPHTEELCVGRDALCDRLAKTSLEHGLTLFFGGPKSGKRTALRSLARAWSSPGGSNPSSLQRLAVLLDLRTAPRFENDRDFYHFALETIWNAMRDRLPDVDLPQIVPNLRVPTSCHWFFENLRLFVRGVPAFDFRIVLILHRADYLLGQPFSEVLERNMVSFFRNSDSRDGRSIGSQSRIGLILSGGAKLYAQSHNPDLHSPLRGVHQREYCMNLTASDVFELVNAAAGKGASGAWLSRRAQTIFDHTGGQASLARSLSETASGAYNKAVSELKDVAVQLLYDSHEELLRCGAYSSAALDALRQTPKLSEQQLREQLRQRGLVETLYQQAGETVAMCGFARWDRNQGILTRCNDFFWPELRPSSNVSSDSLATPESKGFVFTRNQKFTTQWNVVFQGREIRGVPHKIAFVQIATLLRFKGRSFTAMELDNLVNQSPEALSEPVRKQALEVLDERRSFREANHTRPSLSEKEQRRERLVKSLRALSVARLKRAAAECRARLEEAESSASQAESEFDDEAWEELRLRALCIDEVLEERTPGATASATERRGAYKRVREGIDRAIKFFEGKDPSLGIHLRASLWPDLGNGETRQHYCYKGEFVWTAD